MTTGHPAAAHAIVRASSTPPVASHTTSVGRRATRRVTNIAIPASVCALVPCSPAGRTATSNSAFEPSIPTTVPLGRLVPAVLAQPCAIRACGRPRRLSGLGLRQGVTTPRLTHGL